MSWSEFLFETGLGRALAGSTTSSTACKPYNFSAAALTTGDMWDWKGWYTLAILLALFITLFFEICPIEFAMVFSSAMLCAAQIITVPELTAGFSNAGVLVVPCLFVVAEGLASTGAVDYFLGKLLGTPKTLGQALIRMMIPSAFVAAWISSTAVLALLIPVIQRWSKKINRPPSQLFMPLCYAIHLGGTVTLIGWFSRYHDEHHSLTFL
jgi:Na+/H+ antiporter NhaD/arsenite permease-like protein